MLIYRDSFGTPHINGADDAATVFGFAYAQAEDFFWQIEDTYILALGRYAEILGPKGLNSDLLNRAFEIVPRTRGDEFAARARHEDDLRIVHGRIELLFGDASGSEAASDHAFRAVVRAGVRPALDARAVLSLHPAEQ